MSMEWCFLLAIVWFFSAQSLRCCADLQCAVPSILSALLVSAGSSSGLRGQTRPSAAPHAPPEPSTSVGSAATRSDAARRWIWGEVGHSTARVTQTSAATRLPTLWRIHFILHLKISAQALQKHTRSTFLSSSARTPPSICFVLSE